MATELGRVRGLGSAKSGVHHWWLQRVTALGNVALLTWLLVSLVRLATLDHAVVSGWLAQPLVALPMALLVVNVFWHLRLGLQVFIEDYLHGGSRIVALGLLHAWTFIAGGIALFSVLKIAFTGSAA